MEELEWEREGGDDEREGKGQLGNVRGHGQNWSPARLSMHKEAT
jgi:hypothetical protein